MSAQRVILFIACSITLGGCGVFTPEMQTFWERRDQQKEFENLVVNNIKCEIRNGVYDAKQMLATTEQYPGNDIGWLEKQGATVTLKLSVDEKSSLNPGVSYTTPLFSAGIGKS
jgi:hypothetical protein